MRQDKFKLDYFYLWVQTNSDGTLDMTQFKIGHSKDPINHPGDYTTGATRQWVCVLAMPGGRDLETEVKQRFPEYQMYRGAATEIYKNSPELLNFLLSKQRELLVGDSITVFNRLNLGGPISIPRVEVAEAEPKRAPLVSQSGPINRHTIAKAQPPKDPREKVGKGR